MTNDARQRHTHLCRVIDEADQLYHSGLTPTMTDAEYDLLVKERAEIEQANTGLRSTPRVGTSSTGTKVKHLRPMLSLDNVFSVEELVNFFKLDRMRSVTPSDLVWEPKVDGLSLSLTYSGGKLIAAVTRGDGAEGDSVLANAMVIPSIPRTIKVKSDIEVRGEAYIKKEDFAELIEELEIEGTTLSNARNAAAGSLKLKDSAECARRRLSFIAYQAYGVTAASHVDVIDILLTLGFSTTTPQLLLDVNDRLVEELNHARKQLPYETDGVVIKVNDLKLRDEMGLGRRSPRWAVAYKFPPEQKITTLQSVNLQVGRTGVITPVANLLPVDLGGAIVRRASLCNFDEIARLNVAVNDHVIVVRAGEIIPKIVGVASRVLDRVEIKVPTRCPCCGEKVERTDKVAIRCTNYSCPDQIYERLAHAVSKSSLDWDGCGEAQLRALIDHGCTELADLLNIRDVSFMGIAAQAKFIVERECVKSAPLWRKLHALGAESIGKSLCQDLARRYGSLVAIVEDEDGVEAMVGPSRADKLFKEIMRQESHITSLEEAGFLFRESTPATPPGRAAGKVFVITGSLTTGTRDQVAARIEEAGGITKGSVSKSVDYLVIGDEPGGTKLKAAERLGTKTIDEDELYTILGIDRSKLESALSAVDLDDL